MSRIGKQPVAIPAKVEITIDGQHVKVKGPKGELERSFSKLVELKVEGNELVVTRKNEHRESRSMHGLVRSLTANMITGVSEGFKRVLEINGVGYRAEVLKNGRFMRFDLGYSHPIFLELPEGVAAEVDKKNNVTLTSIDKEKIGAAAATIRSFRPPEPYKGKGVKYAEEHITRKVGKSGGR